MMARLRWRIAAVVLVSAAVAAAPVASVGASFTTSAALPGVASASTATVAPLAGGVAARTENGVATVAWTTPPRAEHAVYEVERTVGAEVTDVAPTLSVDGGTTSFIDDLTVPAEATLDGAEDVASGGAHSCAVVGGAAYCWGLNLYGQLGDGTTTTRRVPVAVVGLEGKTVTAVTTGQVHSCALADGAVYCWGYNGYGDLGNGTTIDSGLPVAVQGLDGLAVSDIVGGGHHTCAIADGALWCWGSNVYGELGDGTTIDRLTAVPVTALSALAVTAVAGGQDHTCAIASGLAFCWGSNRLGQLGDGTATDRHSPVPVDTPSGVPVTGIGAGAQHTCLIVTGDVLCTGNNSAGQLGDGTGANIKVVPAAVPGMPPGAVTAIASGLYYTCADSPGASYCWGDNRQGQFGDPGLAMRYQYSPVLAPSAGLRGPGIDHACAITDGVLSCWGRNTEGQAGDGSDQANLLEPTPVAPGNLPVDHYACAAVDWVLAADRCAPGPGVAVSYRIAHTIAGWSQPVDLELADVAMAPAVEYWREGSGGVNEIVFRITNPGDTPLEPRIATPRTVPDGTRISYFGIANGTQWNGAWETNDVVLFLRSPLPPGATTDGIANFGWEGASPATVVTITVTTPGQPPIVLEVPLLGT